MPKSHVFTVNHGQEAIKQLAEEYHAFALRAPLAPDSVVTIEFSAPDPSSDEVEKET